MIARVLIIAGSDSGGGAGIQADIKTVTMLGGHPMTAITAVTAQNTLGVQAVHPVPTDVVMAQIDSVLSDIGVDAVKIGMLGSAETAHAVADMLGDLFPREGGDPAWAPAFAGEQATRVPIVFDPVMIATSGSMLADDATIAAFDRLIGLATLVTPNLPELAALRGEAALAARGAAYLVKGGHAEGDMIEDRLVAADGTATVWRAARIDTQHTHGTGCTLASAIATGLAQGMSLADAVVRARTVVRIALRAAPGLGAGHGPMGQGTVRLDVGLGGPMLNQVTLPVDDHEAARAFYAAIGLRLIVDAPPRYARFESAGGATLSIEAADEIGGRAVTYLECADLDAVVARLRAAGHCVASPRDEDWGWREAQATDPAGNPIRLYQAGENRRFPPWRIACPD